MRINARLKRLEGRGVVAGACPACGGDGPAGVRFIAPSAARAGVTVPTCPRCGVEGRWTFYIEVIGLPQVRSALATGATA